MRQKELLRDAFAGMAAQVDRWLAEVDHTPAFYFDSISQLALDIWSRGRVTLVGDAGYCPGPAVGGSTSLAVLGAYVLAGELTRLAAIICARSRPTSTRWPRRSVVAGSSREAPPRPSFPAPPRRYGR